MEIRAGRDPGAAPDDSTRNGSSAVLPRARVPTIASDACDARELVAPRETVIRLRVVQSGNGSLQSLPRAVCSAVGKRFSEVTAEGTTEGARSVQSCRRHARAVRGIAQGREVVRGNHGRATV
jgi:hypothetical protein